MGSDNLMSNTKVVKIDEVISFNVNFHFFPFRFNLQQRHNVLPLTVMLKDLDFMLKRKKHCKRS